MTCDWHSKDISDLLHIATITVTRGRSDEGQSGTPAWFLSSMLLDALGRAKISNETPWGTSWHTRCTLQCRHIIPALNAWAARAYYTTARPIGTQIHGHGCTDYLKIERRCYYYIQVIDVLGLFFDMLSMGFYTTRHWQTFGRLVQELNICTVAGV